jgi:hypothetical protein
MRRTVFLSTFLFAAALVLLQTDYCSPSPYPKLSKLELYVPDINGQNAISGFRPDGILYEVELPFDSSDTAVLVVEVDPQDAGATIQATYDSLPVALDSDGQAPLTLVRAHSEIRVTVTAEDGKGWTYTVSIERLDPCRGLTDGSPCSEGRGRCYGGRCNHVPVSVTVGSKEVVFDWTTDRCEDLDIPDSEAHPIRAEDGSLVLFSGHGIRRGANYVSRGPEFDSLERDCTPALVPADSLAPESYENQEWLWSPYREGSIWHVLIHNEFKPGEPFPCEETDDGLVVSTNCIYNSITYAASTDGGRTFEKPSPPAHVVAPHPLVWTPPPPNWPPNVRYSEGYFTPSNIVRGPDHDYYYAVIRSARSKFTTIWDLCLMRTDTLSDPSSWRAWDGTGFNLQMRSPYLTDDPIPFCQYINQSLGTASTAATLTYNTYLQRYMLVSDSLQTIDGDEVCGIYFALSTDLIHWSDGQLISKIDGWCRNPAGTGTLEPNAVWVLYPSIVDHADPTPNFEHPGRTPHLYYVRWNDYSLDRDLVRVPIKLTIAGPLCDGVDCDDQDLCTEDLCNGADGSCEHTPRECDDFNECTVDSCDPTSGCQSDAVANGTPCAEAMGTCQDGSCSVRFPCTEQGIRDAIALGGGPHTFDCATPTTVATTAEIGIDNDVILDGEGELTVDGGGSHRVFSVSPGVTAELEGLTIIGGAAIWQGGGIANNGVLTLTSTTVSENQAGGGGGGVFNAGTMTLNLATIADNQADSAGGILNQGALTVVDTTVSGNASVGEAGGLSNHPGATASLTRTTLEGNNVTSGSGGGIANSGTITLIDTTVSGNQVRWHGGGIFQNGSMVLTNSTISGNTAVYGGGLQNFAPGWLTLTNSTVSGNSATEASGGGIVNEASMSLLSSTVAANSAADIGSTAIWNTGAATSRNTLIVGNCGMTRMDSYGPSGGNIESPGDSCFEPYPGNLVSVPTPLLELRPLQDNGGPTLTHLPDAGSVAIDNPAVGAVCVDATGQPLATDQRGVARPQGPLCDVGSVEFLGHCEGVDCDDQNDCTEDQCDAATGICSNNPLPNGSTCDFGGFPGSCQDGECLFAP